MIEGGDGFATLWHYENAQVSEIQSFFSEGSPIIAGTFLKRREKVTNHLQGSKDISLLLAVIETILLPPGNGIIEFAAVLG